MLIETGNMVPSSRFRARLPEYLAAARERAEPVCVTHNGEVAGFFIGTAEYERMLGMAAGELLAARKGERAISHARAMARMKAVLARVRKSSRRRS